MRRSIYTPDHEAFRAGFRQFLDREAVPHTQRWEEAGLVDRSFFEAAGRNGFLGFEAPEEFGGLGIDDFRYNAIMSEEVVATGTAGDGFTLGNDILAPYLIHLTTPEQRKRWLPGFTAGAIIPAIAMTEPTTGSDLAAVRTTARREGDRYVIDGAKTFITNGVQADLVLVLARTGERDGRGLSLIAVEAGTPGFSKGTALHKIGRKAQDTAELFFDQCRVPVDNLIGEPGSGMHTVLRNLPRERLSMAVIAVASAERALAMAVRHCRDRTSFGVPLGSHQALRFELAEMHTEVGVARIYVDRCVQGLLDGELTAEEAAGAKYWTTDLQCSVIDRCLQLFGGYGYVEEYPIARMWRDARVQRIYGGTNEIMKEVVGRAVVGLLSREGEFVELVEGLHPLAAVLRRYSYAYTAAHDFRVCSEIMVDDYVLRMGEHEIRGRDAEYIPATEKQYRQYPGLGFTVHELVLGDDRAALHFTEHGRSVLHGGAAAWSGISMYRWDGRRLVECRVEQDYHGRRAQQRTGRVNPILAPGVDPWTAEPAGPDPGAEGVVRTWLTAGGLADAPIGSLDDEHAAPARRMLMSAPRATVLDLFGARDRVAFHVLLHGSYAGGLDHLDGYRHRPATLYVTGLATVRDGSVTGVRAVTDRLAAERRLDAQRGRL